MPKTRELTVEERGTIVRMRLEGATHAEIASTVNCSTSTVQRVAKKSNDLGTLENAPRSGRPPKFQARGLRELKRAVTIDKHAPLADIVNNLSVQASYGTVRRELHKLGFKNRVVVRKPFKRQKRYAADLHLVEYTESALELSKLTG